MSSASSSISSIHRRPRIVQLVHVILHVGSAGSASTAWRPAGNPRPAPSRPWSAGPCPTTQLCGGLPQGPSPDRRLAGRRRSRPCPAARLAGSSQSGSQQLRGDGRRHHQHPADAELTEGGQMVVGQGVRAKGAGHVAIAGIPERQGVPEARAKNDFVAGPERFDVPHAAPLVRQVHVKRRSLGR